MKHAPRRRLAGLAGLLAALVMAAPTFAIVNGQPDDEEHPYVGQIIFYVPDGTDSRFNDPGSWGNCSGTLLSPTVFLTAGHCTFGTGLNGTATTADGGDGGNDVWVTFEEEADYAGLPPSTTFIPDGNDDRYIAWRNYFNSNDTWIRGEVVYPHPQYNDNAFLFYDAGIIILSEPYYPEPNDRGEQFGELPSEGYLDPFVGVAKRDARFEAVGYGVEISRGYGQDGGDTRLKTVQRIVNVKGALGIHGDISIALGNNNGKTHTGGTCNGDSGGPVFVNNTNLIVAVTSYGISGACKGIDGAYRIDQQDDLDFINSFLGTAN